MIQLAPIKPLFCTNKYTFLEIRQFLLILNQSHKIINNKKLFGVAGGTFYLYSYQISVFIVTYYWDNWNNVETALSSLPIQLPV